MLFERSDVQISNQENKSENSRHRSNSIWGIRIWDEILLRYVVLVAPGLEFIYFKSVSEVVMRIKKRLT